MVLEAYRSETFQIRGQAGQAAPSQIHTFWEQIESLELSLAGRMIVPPFCSHGTEDMQRMDCHGLCALSWGISQEENGFLLFLVVFIMLYPALFHALGCLRALKR